MENHIKSDLVERFENNLELAAWDQDTFTLRVLKAIMIIQLLQNKNVNKTIIYFILNN
jgi:hypothetical protein